MVPNASESGMFRFGFLTSPAVNVMLFHASEEKSEFVCATQIPTNKPKGAAAVRPRPTSCNLPLPCHRLTKVKRTAFACPPRNTTEGLRAVRLPVYVMVHTYSTSV